MKVEGKLSRGKQGLMGGQSREGESRRSGRLKGDTLTVQYVPVGGVKRKEQLSREAEAGVQ